MGNPAAKLRVAVAVVALCSLLLVAATSPDMLAFKRKPEEKEDDCLVHHPKLHDHSRTLVFMHGLGDTGHGWLDMLKGRLPPGTRIVAPNAPTAIVSGNGGARMPSWFDMTTFDADGLLDEKVSPCKGLGESKARITAILEREQAKLEAAGSNVSRLFVGGFSQGAALAVHVGYGYEGGTLGGIVGFSGWAIAWSQFRAAEPNKQTATLLHHGDRDDVIPLRVADGLVQRLEEARLPHRRIVSAGCGHSSTEAAMQALVDVVAADAVE